MISLGCACFVKHFIDNYNGKIETLFFDRIISNINSVIYLLNNYQNIDTILTPENLIVNFGTNGNITDVQHKTIYLTFIHDLAEDTEENRLKLCKKYIERFTRIINYMKSDRIIHFIFSPKTDSVELITSEQILELTNSFLKINPTINFRLHLIFHPIYSKNLDFEQLKILCFIYTYILVEKYKRDDWQLSGLCWRRVYKKIRETIPTKINHPLTHLISYASNYMLFRKNILYNQADNTDWFDTIKIYTREDLDPEFLQKYSSVFDTYTKGDGYYMWKPYIIYDMLSKIKDGDYLIYIDVGCSINLNGKERLDQYLKLIDNSNSKMLRFSLTTNDIEWICPTIYKKIRIKIPGLYGLLCRIPKQLVGGIILLKKCDWTINYFKQVLELLPFCISKHKRHRHDQSIMSIVYKHMGGDLIIPDETYSDKELDKNAPFWATRIKTI